MGLRQRPHSSRAFGLDPKSCPNPFGEVWLSEASPGSVLAMDWERVRGKRCNPEERVFADTPRAAARACPIDGVMKALPISPNQEAKDAGRDHASAGRVELSND